MSAKPLESTPETEEAAKVVQWFNERGWTVYQEVEVEKGGPIADIVATLGTRTWVVEVKASRSVGLLAQALRWAQMGELVSVATPKVRSTEDRDRLWNEFCERHGFGQFVDGECIASPISKTNAQPGAVRAALRGEHRSGEYAQAGSANGGHFTGFAELKRELARQVEASDAGVILSKFTEGMGAVMAHKSLRSALKRGQVKGLELQGGRVVPAGFNRHSMRRAES